MSWHVSSSVVNVKCKNGNSGIWGNIHDDLIFRSIQWHHGEPWMSVSCAGSVFLQHGAGFYRHEDECSHPHQHAPKTYHLEQCIKTTVGVT